MLRFTARCLESAKFPELLQREPPKYGSVPQTKNSQPAAKWHKTFDFAFLIGMIVYAGVLLLLTYFYEPQWLHEPHFWVMQLPKLGVMILVSVVGGLICRWFCKVDEKGYFLTSRSSKFKVNFRTSLPTLYRWWSNLDILGRLLEHGRLLHYAELPPAHQADSREFQVFVLQFNSLDRPEDRPNALKWIILGNIAPESYC